MTTSIPPESEYVLTNRITLPGERAAFYRAASRGRWIRIRPGVYLPAGAWNGLNAEDRHVARARAAALVDRGAVFSHLTAALIWGLPLIDPPPALPSVIVPRAAGGRSSQSTVRFATGEPDEVVRIGGLRVVGLRETVVAVAATWGATTSVPILDAALAGRARDGAVVTRDELRTIPTAIAHRRVEFAVGFADPSSGSAGESLSRLAIHRAGLPAPESQARFDDDHGLIGFADFWWPDAGLIGEFDGAGKYRRDLSGHGRTPAEIVIAEKRREDRLRALGPRVVRWGWSTARSVTALRETLVGAGLRATKSQSHR